MAQHTAEEVLASSQAVYPQADSVSKVHPEDDQEWWVTDAEYNTFALAWYDATDTFNIRPYKP